MVDKNDKINDKKRLIKLVRKVLKEELAQQEKKHIKPYYWKLFNNQTTNRRS